MTKVVALQTWSNGTITMDEKSVLDIDDALATDLIAKGIVADAATYFGGGSGGGVLVVHEDENATLDKTWQEIHDAMDNGIVLIKRENETISALVLETTAIGGRTGTTYTVYVTNSGSIATYRTSSASGYPVE